MIEVFFGVATVFLLMLIIGAFILVADEAKPTDDL